MKLPQSVLDQAMIQNIRTKGLLYKDKQLAQEAYDLADQKACKRCNTNKLLQDYIDDKQDKETRHECTNDLTWMPLEDLQRLKDYETLLSKSHWSKVKTNELEEKLKPVFKCFWEEQH